jgi:hypothetical protein
MRCPKCKLSDAVRTIESRHQKAANAVRRRRECTRCLIRWTTEEQIVSAITRIDKSRPRPKRQAQTKKILLPVPANKPSCHICAHWQSNECGFKFPDPFEEGPGFAADCDLYEKKTDQG